MTHSTPPAPRRATLKDVARAAGVSHQTVSRAINDKGEIDPATRRRVLDAARELRYRPSRHARGLVRGDLVTIGLIVPDVVNPFFPEFIAGVIDAAGGRGWQVVVGSSENDRARELTLVASLGRQVDALIGYLDHTDEELGPHLGGVPLVIVDRGTEPSVHGRVHVDIAGGIGQALAHLVTTGHERIGLIDCHSPCDAEIRRATYRAVADRHGLPVGDDWIITVEQTMDGGAEGFRRLRAEHPDVTAMLAFNDLVAIGAFQAARADKVSVPGEVALVGFDGLSVGELLDPPLSTVYLDKHRLGELAVAQAGRLLAGEATVPVVLGTELVVRGTG